MTKTKNDVISDIVLEINDRLRNMILGWVPQYEDAEDILQDVIYRFIGSFDQIRSLEASYSWLLRTAKNRIVDFYRKRSRTMEGSHINHQFQSGQGVALLEELLANIGDSPEDQFHQSEIAHAIEEAIDALPTDQKRVFIWHEIEGLSFREMRILTGDSVNTLLSRKRYAVQSLRQSLKELRKG